MSGVAAGLIFGADVVVGVGVFGGGAEAKGPLTPAANENDQHQWHEHPKHLFYRHWYVIDGSRESC